VAASGQEVAGKEETAGGLAEVNKRLFWEVLEFAFLWILSAAAYKRGYRAILVIFGGAIVTQVVMWIRRYKLRKQSSALSGRSI
jgi:hypothetical protein